MKKTFVFLTAAVLVFTAGCSGKRESAETLMNKAYASAVSGDWIKALSFSKDALKNKPTAVEARIIYALALENNGKADEALDETKRVLKLEPDNFFALYTEGRLLYQLGRAETSIQPLRKALQQRPDDPNVLLLLAQAARKINDPKTAMSCYAALTRLPAYKKSPAVWNELAVCMLMLNYPPRRVYEYFKYAYDLNRHSPSAVLNVAILCDQYIPAWRKSGIAWYKYYQNMTGNNSALADKRAAVEARIQSIR